MPRSRHSPSRSPSPERSELRDQRKRPSTTISESDYFLKSAEFRVWLKEEKGKYFDELSGEKARSYFRKFVKAWNRGKLSKSLYSGVDPSTQAATTQTAYKWSFASNKSRVDSDALRAAREEVGQATYGRDQSEPQPGPSDRNAGSSSGRMQGPTLPSASDLVLAREAESEYHNEERKYKRKRDIAEAKGKVEDMVGPKEVGREGMLEKKRAKRESDRTFREKGDDGYEADESTLLGGGDSFRERLAQRDAARRRFEEKRNAAREEKEVSARERATAMREKDKATMDMFKQLAKQRFG